MLRKMWPRYYQRSIPLNFIAPKSPLSYWVKFNGFFWLRLRRTVVNSKISLKKGGEEWQTFLNY